MESKRLGIYLKKGINISSKIFADDEDSINCYSFMTAPTFRLRFYSFDKKKCKIKGP